jgi:hypothetical protein
VKVRAVQDKDVVKENCNKVNKRCSKNCCRIYGTTRGIKGEQRKLGQLIYINLQPLGIQYWRLGERGGYRDLVW